MEQLSAEMACERIDYTLMNTTKPLDQALFNYLAARSRTDMNFLNPFFLLGCLALAIPVLIHLVRREKTEIIPFSSLMFLFRVPKQLDTPAEDQEPFADGSTAVYCWRCWLERLRGLISRSRKHLSQRRQTIARLFCCWTILTACGTATTSAN